MSKLITGQCYSCITCKHQGMQYCPFHTGYTGWDDVYCSKWGPKEPIDSKEVRRGE